MASKGHYQGPWNLSQQCDQIGRVFEVVGNKFSAKNSQKIVSFGAVLNTIILK